MLLGGTFFFGGGGGGGVLKPIENLTMQRENLTQLALTSPQETGTLKRKQPHKRAIGAFTSHHG
jgi:hypothetical protein